MAALTEDKIAHFKQVLLDEKTRLEAEREQYAGPDRDDTEEGAQASCRRSTQTTPPMKRPIYMTVTVIKRRLKTWTGCSPKSAAPWRRLTKALTAYPTLTAHQFREARLEALPYANLTVEQAEDTLED